MSQPHSRRRSVPATKKRNIGLYQDGGRPSRHRWFARQVQDTARLARTLVVGTAAPSVWLLRGPLGSGKTAFVRSALRALGYRGPVTSPTFTLVRHYRLGRGRWQRAVHVDAYRITRQAEEAALDLAAAVTDPDCIVFIEWPERLRAFDWSGAVQLRFSHYGRGRRITLDPS